MATLGDVKKSYRALKELVELFGCAEDFELKVHNAFQKIGRAIMEECNVNNEKARGLPNDTLLGIASYAAYQEFLLLSEVSGS